GLNAGISDEESAFDVITVKNGEVSGYGIGVFLGTSTRVSVLGVTSHDNSNIGIFAGSQGLVKASEVYNNTAIGILVRDRARVQHCKPHHNGASGFSAWGNNGLITRNFATSNALSASIRDLPTGARSPTTPRGTTRRRASTRAYCSAAAATWSPRTSRRTTTVASTMRSTAPAP